MDNNFLVSVRCISYNHAPYIKDCMNGFTMQETNFPYVCVIDDDASTDGEPEVINNYLAENFNLDDEDVVRKEETDDYHMIFAQHKINKNCFFAVYFLNYNHYSIKKSRDKYVAKYIDGVKYMAICEGDDYWIDPLKLQKQVVFMENNQNCSLVYNRTKRYSERKKIFLSDNDNYEQSQYVRAKDIIEEGGLFVSTCSMLYLKSVIENYPQFCIKCHVGDYPLAIMCAMKGDVYYLNEAMSVYRVDNSNSWVGKQQSEKKMSLSRLNGIVSEVRMLQGFKTLYPQYSDSFNNRIYSFLLGNVPYRYLDARGNKMFIETFSDELAILNKKRRAFFYLKASHLGILFHLFSFLKHKIKHLIK